MNVVIRADASIKIGTGHVMRCLTLADALRDNDIDVRFICRNHKGNLISFIESKGYQVYLIGEPDSTSTQETNDVTDKDNMLAHAEWLGVTQKKDGEECKAILKQIQPDWLIVDHYGIDKVWQQELKENYQKLMVIDDLADREHICDLLLDQTFGRSTDDYKTLVPKGCKILVGAQYALLRPEFSEWREASLKRRVNPKLNNLLISLGGVDQDNITGKVLERLETCDLPAHLEITVVLGDTAPHINSVKETLSRLPFKSNIVVGASNMAELMANSDFSIGAAGATTWERCCLGVPSLLLVLADNQRKIAETISEANVASKLEVKQVDDICAFIEIDDIKMKQLTINSASVTDGRGVSLVLEYIL
jgi:UDP-2,4-diacetamido-2,4,6-trideoxy-beta-L-altropyranose hydrolase